MQTRYFGIIRINAKNGKLRRPKAKWIVYVLGFAYAIKIEVLFRLDSGEFSLPQRAALAIILYVL